MKDVSEKLRLAITRLAKDLYAAEEYYNPRNSRGFLERAASDSPEAASLFTGVVKLLLPELDELAEIKRLLDQSAPVFGEKNSLEMWGSGHGYIKDFKGQSLVVFGPEPLCFPKYLSPLEALRSLLPPPEEVASTANATTMEIGVINGMKLTLTATPEEKP